MKVALVHYWLVNMAGGEKVLEALCRLYPQADIFTHVVDREKLLPEFRRHKISTTFITPCSFESCFVRSSNLWSAVCSVW